MSDSVFQTLAACEAASEPAALCTIMRTRGSTPRAAGTRMLVRMDGSIVGTIGGGELEQRVVEAALEALDDGRSRTLSYDMTDPERGDPGVCGGQLEVFVDPVIPAPLIVVVGGGHVGKAVVSLAHWLGYQVVVSDDRPEFSTPEAVPDADRHITAPLESLPDHLNVTSRTYLILCTRNVEVDVAGLPALLDTSAAYIGVIGSRRRWATTRRMLAEKGIPPVQLDRVVSPMGLELNAETPEEIAVSILAEIIMLERGGDGTRMQVTPAAADQQA